MAEKNRLPRKYSLKSKGEISHLLQTGNKISGDYFNLVWETGKNFKYGIFVSKKYGNAVKRNRIKRLIREAIRLNKNILSKPAKLAILPKLTDGESGFKEINAEISRTFKLINIGA